MSLYEINILVISLLATTDVVVNVSYAIEQIKKKNYILRKDYQPKDIKKVIVPPALKVQKTSVDLKDPTTLQMRKNIIEFQNVLTKNFPITTLNIFYNNINNLKINFSKSSATKKKETGWYLSEDNHITIIKPSSIFHELFHMSSTIYDQEKNIIFSGFEQIQYDPETDDYLRIGSGLNEGYTELLNQRFFGMKYHLNAAYVFEMTVAEKLEAIIGQKKMSTLYLTANLKGLIDELSKYTSENKIKKFITEMDFMRNHRQEQFFIRNNMIEFSIENIYRFLIECHHNKMNELSRAGIIETDEYLLRLTKFSSSLVPLLEYDWLRFRYMIVAGKYRKLANSKRRVKH